MDWITISFVTPSGVEVCDKAENVAVEVYNMEENVAEERRKTWLRHGGKRGGTLVQRKTPTLHSSFLEKKMADCMGAGEFVLTMAVLDEYRFLDCGHCP